MFGEPDNNVGPGRKRWRRVDGGGDFACLPAGPISFARLCLETTRMNGALPASNAGAAWRTAPRFTLDIRNHATKENGSQDKRFSVSCHIWTDKPTYRYRLQDYLRRSHGRHSTLPQSACA